VEKIGFQQIQNTVTSRQRKILTTTWRYFLEHKQWIPCRLLHNMFGGKSECRPLMEQLGGAIVLEYENHAANIKYYQLTLLGAFLTDEGNDYPQLLAGYLKYVYEQCARDAELTTVRSQNVAADLELDPEQIFVLGELIRLGSFSSGMSIGPEEWSADVPADIEDLPRDLLTYVQECAIRSYDPNMPVGATDRQTYILGKSRNGLRFMSSSRTLCVFLCHASHDKPAVRELYKRLSAQKWITPWLDEESLLPGQDFDLEIDKATREADAIIICLSNISVAKEGYVNREIRRALDIAQEKLEGAIYVIPLRLDDCTPSFEQLKKLHWLDYFTPNAHERLLKSLRARAEALGIEIPGIGLEQGFQLPSSVSIGESLDLFRFIEIQPQSNSKAAYPYWIGKYPVTNSLYERFLNAPDYLTQSYWCGFLNFDEKCRSAGRWGDEGWKWLQNEMKKTGKHLAPKSWDDENFGKANPINPVVGVSWYEANAYCTWLLRHWNEMAESHANVNIHPRAIRLSLDFEWTGAAGGEIPANRYPWDLSDTETSDATEIVRRANIVESAIGQTTPVNIYVNGASPDGVMDMAGNVWEWQANHRKMLGDSLGVRGGSWRNDMDSARVARYTADLKPELRFNFVGFRLVCLPSW
jgi:formylglycine-generating enzyme required for sulfatase activity